MQPPQIQTPTTPWASDRRRDRPPSLLSPSFSRSAFTATAAAAAEAGAGADAGEGDRGADVSEHPCVTLFEWWLDSVEGDDQKIAVAGLFERNQSVEEFGPAAIAKRHGRCVLETEDRIVLLIYGSLNLSRTLANGYTSEVCEKFLIGFPHWWQSCNQLYPKAKSSHTRCPPNSSYTSNSEVDPTRFYLEQFQLGERLASFGSSLISKCGGSAKSSSHNDAAFQKSSYLSNGAPRFEEYTCDSDIATNENAAASNDHGERHEAVCNEVDNVEMHLTAGKALRERVAGDIDTNASLVPTVEVANDAGNGEADNAPPTVTFEENSDIPTNGKTAALNSDSESSAALSKEVDNVGKVLRERDGNIDTNASLVLTVEGANDAGNEETDNAPPTSTFEECSDIGTNRKAASLNSDSESYAALSKEVDNVEIEFTAGSVLCESGHGDIALSKKAAVDEEMLTSGCLDMQKLPYQSNETPRCEENSCVGDIPTNEDGAARKDNSERCTAVSKEVHSVEIGLIVGSTITERGHDGITKVSLAPTVECTDDAVNEGVDNTSLLGYKRTPVASLNSQGCQEKHQHIPSNEKASGSPKKQRSALKKLQDATRSPLTSPVPYASGPPKKQRSALEKLQGSTRSPLTSPVPYAYGSPLTRGSGATSLSMSTPEALKLRKTRSGRVVVPTLDAGCQRIVYDMDGTITGVIGLDSPSPEGGSKVKTYSRRKRRAEPAAGGSKVKTYARKKSRLNEHLQT